MQRIDTDPDQFPIVVVGNKVDLPNGVDGVDKAAVSLCFVL